MTGFRYLFVGLLSPLPNNQQLTNKNLFQIGLNSIELKGSPGTGILTSSPGNYEWQVVLKNYFVPLCTKIFTRELSPERHFWMWLTPSCSWKWVASTGKPSAGHSPTPSQELASSPFPPPHPPWRTSPTGWYFFVPHQRSNLLEGTDTLSVDFSVTMNAKWMI